MFAGTLTRNVEIAAAQYTGMIHSTRFDIAIQLEARAKMSARSPDYDVTAINKSGRKKLKAAKKQWIEFSGTLDGVLNGAGEKE